MYAFLCSLHRYFQPPDVLKMNWGNVWWFSLLAHSYNQNQIFLYCLVSKGDERFPDHNWWSTGANGAMSQMNNLGFFFTSPLQANSVCPLSSVMKELTTTNARNSFGDLHLAGGLKLVRPHHTHWKDSNNTSRVILFVFSGLLVGVHLCKICDPTACHSKRKPMTQLTNRKGSRDSLQGGPKIYGTKATNTQQKSRYNATKGRHRLHWGQVQLAQLSFKTMIRWRQPLKHWNCLHLRMMEYRPNWQKISVRMKRLTWGCPPGHCTQIWRPMNVSSHYTTCRSTFAQWFQPSEWAFCFGDVWHTFVDRNKPEGGKSPRWCDIRPGSRIEKWRGSISRL